MLLEMYCFQSTVTINEKSISLEWSWFCKLEMTFSILYFRRHLKLCPPSHFTNKISHFQGHCHPETEIVIREQPHLQGIYTFLDGCVLTFFSWIRNWIHNPIQFSHAWLLWIYDFFANLETEIVIKDHLYLAMCYIVL